MACSLSLCNSASAILEKGTQGGERRRKTNTRCSHPKKLMDTPRGFARTRGRANGRLRPAPGVADRAVRAAGWLAGLPGPDSASGSRPPGRLAASPRRRRRPRQSGTWAAGNHWEGALAPCSFSSLTSRPLAPPLGCAGPAVAALGGSRQAGGARAVAAGWECGCPKRGRAARVRVCTWGAGARRAARAHGWRSWVDPRSVGPQQDEVAPPQSTCQPTGLWQKAGGPELWPPSILAAF